MVAVKVIFLVMQSVQMAHSMRLSNLAEIKAVNASDVKGNDADIEPLFTMKESGARVRLFCMGHVSVKNDNMMSADSFHVHCDEEFLTITEGGLAHTNWMPDVPHNEVTLRGSEGAFPKTVDMEWIPVFVERPGTVIKCFDLPLGEYITLCQFQPDQGEEMTIPASMILGMRGGPNDKITAEVTDVSRQGKSKKVETQFYKPGDDEYSKPMQEYVLQEEVTLQKDKLTFDFPAYTTPGKFCGTELFSTRSLQCNKVRAEELYAEVHSFDKLAPAERGIGLEFELVAREVPADIWENEEWSADIPDHVEQYSADHAQNYEDPDEYEELVQKIQAENYCFRNSIKGKETLGQVCTENSDCRLTQFCMDVGKGSGKCVARAAGGNCTESMKQAGQCPLPLPLSRWHWESDVSVTNLELEDIGEIPGADDSETTGVGMELVAPGPPHVLAGKTGMRSALELLGVLRRMGVQAGPSQGLHVHVNVASSEAAGSPLSLRGIASVWVAYAQYQLVIDEMLSPNRPDNPWANRLFLAKGQPSGRPLENCQHNPIECVAVFFQRIHEYVNDPANSGIVDVPGPSKKQRMDFCNFVHGAHPRDEPCKERYPHQRYLQVNMIPLAKYGTMEFRVHSATINQERVARWTQFLVAFVEYFGQSTAGLQNGARFLANDFEKGLKDLRTEQRSVNNDGLFQKLQGTIDAKTPDFYKHRQWEKNDAICKHELSAPAEMSLAEVKARGSSAPRRKKLANLRVGQRRIPVGRDIGDE